MQSSARILLYVLAGLPSAVVAQSPPMPANNVLSIYRESVKVGKGPAHDAHETAWAGALVLISMVFLVSLAARLATRGLQRRTR